MTVLRNIQHKSINTAETAISRQNIAFSIKFAILSTIDWAQWVKAAHFKLIISPPKPFKR